MKFSKPWYRKSRRAWFVTLNGKQVKLGVAKQEALDAYHKLMTDPPRAEEPKDAPKEYVVGIIQRFMRHVRAELADDTIEWYRYRLQKYVDHLIGHSLDGLTVDELRPHHVREWADSDSKLSSGSKRNYIRAVQRCFNWAAEDGLIPFSPIAAMKKPKAGKRETVVRPAEFQELLSFVPDPALADLLEVTFDCGCRPQESLKVTAAHVDLTNSRWVLQQSEGKPGDMRVVCRAGCQWWPGVATFDGKTAVVSSSEAKLPSPCGASTRSVRRTATRTTQTTCPHPRFALCRGCFGTIRDCRSKRHCRHGSGGELSGQGYLGSRIYRWVVGVIWRRF